MAILRFSTTLKKDEITSLAIGGFDGMHKAHMALVDRLDKNGVLFVIDKGFSNLTPGEYRCKFVKNGCVFLDLKDVKNFSKDEFIDFLKVNFKSLRKIIVGYDFRFGKDRSADASSFKKYFQVEVVSEVKVDGISVHSGVIREFLKEAKIELANKLLGRNYAILAKSVKGQGLGSKKLVATINFETEFLLPKEGVYATRTKIKDKWYKSITFIGKRETTDKRFACETHLLDEFISFSPKIIEVEFIKYIRDNKKFDTIEALKNQIKKDIKIAKDVLSECQDKY